MTEEIVKQSLSYRMRVMVAVKMLREGFRDDEIRALHGSIVLNEAKDQIKAGKVRRDF